MWIHIQICMSQHTFCCSVQSARPQVKVLLQHQQQEESVFRCSVTSALISVFKLFNMKKGVSTVHCSAERDSPSLHRIFGAQPVTIEFLVIFLTKAFLQQFAHSGWAASSRKTSSGSSYTPCKTYGGQCAAVCVAFHYIHVSTQAFLWALWAAPLTSWLGLCSNTCGTFQIVCSLNLPWPRWMTNDTSRSREYGYGYVSLHTRQLFAAIALTLLLMVVEEPISSHGLHDLCFRGKQAVKVL